MADLVADRAGRRVLDGLTFRAEPGERLAITGHSGVGKTTLLHALAGVEPIQAGRVTLVDGRDGEAVGVEVGEATRTRIGLVPQHHGLVALLTAAENVELALQAARRPRAELRLVAAEALACVGLAGRGEHLVDELSGGEQQRVAVARALAMWPDVVLADEPTSQLDAQSRVRVLDALQQAARRGAVVVLTTHDEEVAASCERHLHLDEGRLT